MQDIAKNYKLISGYPLTDQDQVQKKALTVHAVQDVHIAAKTPIGMISIRLRLSLRVE